MVLHYVDVGLPLFVALTLVLILALGIVMDVGPVVFLAVPLVIFLGVGTILFQVRRPVIGSMSRGSPGLKSTETYRQLLAPNNRASRALGKRHPS